MNTIPNQIFEIERELNLLDKAIPCTEEEIEICKQARETDGQLPSGMLYSVFSGIYGYYKVEDYFRDREDRKYLLTLQRTKYLKTIKNCVVFFTVTAVIGIVAYIFSPLLHM